MQPACFFVCVCGAQRWKNLNFFECSKRTACHVIRINQSAPRICFFLSVQRTSQHYVSNNTHFLSTSISLSPSPPHRHTHTHTLTFLKTLTVFTPPVSNRRFWLLSNGGRDSRATSEAPWMKGWKQHSWRFPRAFRRCM